MWLSTDCQRIQTLDMRTTPRTVALLTAAFLAVIGRLDDGRRFLAVLPRDPALLDAMERSEQVGRPGTVRQDGDRNLFALRPDAWRSGRR
jgi:hypothetical protein